MPAVPVTTQYVLSVGASLHNGLYLRLPGVSASILEERSGGQVTHLWCWGSNARAGGDLNKDGMPDVVVCFTAAGAAQYYHCDDLGNTLALTDSGGTVLERYAYDDYGQPQFLGADGSPLVDSTGQPVTASPLGNPFLFHGLEWDGETGLLGDDGGDYFDPQTGRAVRGKVKSIRDNGGSGFAGNNPWSGGGPVEMKNGVVKFFNEAKGFGMVTGGGGGGSAFKTKPKPTSEGKKEYVGHVSLLK